MMVKMNKLKSFLAHNLYLLVLIIFSAIFAGFFIYSIFEKYDLEIDQSFIVHRDQPGTKRLLDGKTVLSQNARLKPVIVMMENHFDSRPISGLESASIIYETIVEGDITRFLAIFDPLAQASKIGPVRSARPFFVEISEEWNGVYFHAGGSPAALDMLKDSDLYNINEISGDGIYFWRDVNRNPPHNLYTSMNQINRSIAAKEVSTTTDFIPWKFKKNQINGEDFVEEVEVNFSSNPLYQVKYVYNQQDNKYTRYQAGSIHKTESGIILKADNIIKQFVDAEIIDSYGRLSIDLDSGGPAEVHLNGQQITGSWKKENGRTKFYDAENREISFNPGTVWIELIFN